MAAVKMIDTVRFKGEWPLNALPLSEGWREGWRHYGCMRLRITRCTPLLTSAEVSPPKLFLTSVEVSLSKLFFGHNGHLLKNQSELSAAFTKLEKELAHVAELPSLADLYPSRIDIAWNFALPSDSLILAHSRLRVPGIRPLPTVFRGGEGSILWKSADELFAVKLYNKSRQMRAAGEVLRAEISLCGRQVRERLNDDWQNFDALYRSYRRILAGIPAIEKSNKALGWQEALGMESLEIRTRFLARLCEGKPERTIRRWRKRVENAAANLPKTFSWKTILPLRGPSAVVTVEPKLIRRLPVRDLSFQEADAAGTNRDSHLTVRPMLNGVRK